MSHRALLLVMGLAVAIGFCGPSSAAAQGNGNGRPKGPKSAAPAPSPSPAPSTGSGSATTTTTTPTSTSSVVVDSSTTTVVVPTATVTSFRQFGAWLDDTSAPTPGEGYTTLGIGHWVLDGLSQTNVPMLGAGVGLTDRLQVSGSVPFYRLHYQGATYSGMDDVYVGAKYTLIDPTLTISEIGLAVSPVMEILSAGAPDGRVHFALPVSLELRRPPFRVYGSAGYFTRGSVFSGTALEWTSRQRLTISGALTQSYSVKDDQTLDLLGVGRRRMDVSGSLSYPFADTAAGYVSVSRSLSSIAEGGTRLGLSGGVSIRFSAVRPTP